MADSVTTSHSLTAPARHESSLAREHEFTDCIILLGNVCNDTLDNLLSPYLEGCGRVDLVRLEVKIVTTASGQKVQVGVDTAGSTRSIDQVCRKVNGIYFISNTKNVGQEVVRPIKPEDNLSLQIRPNSADFPMLKLLCKADTDVDISFHFFIKVHGMRVRFGDLKGN
jgi:hypothetical protein